MRELGLTLAFSQIPPFDLGDVGHRRATAMQAACLRGALEPYGPQITARFSDSQYDCASPCLRDRSQMRKKSRALAAHQPCREWLPNDVHSLRAENGGTRQVELADVS